MATSQDGPTLVGGVDETLPGRVLPLLIDPATGRLLVDSTGGGAGSDVNLIEVGGVAVTLGQKTMAGSIPVVIASDQSGGASVTISAVAVASTVSSVNDSASNVTLLASNASRKGYKLFNDSTVTAYVKEGVTATTSDYTYQLLSGGGYYESVGVGVYTGQIDCIWASNAAGAMRVTELQ